MKPVDAVAWATSVAVALTIASWAKYWMRRTSDDDVDRPHLRGPLVLTALFVAGCVALAGMDPVAVR